MTKTIAPTICLAIVILIGVCGVVAQNKTPDEVIKIDTALVSVPVIVSDRQGRYVPNLAVKDFTLYQDDVKQNIEFFAATEEPLNIALLIDTSRSTTRALGDIKRAALDFIELLKPQDKAMIVSFDYQTQILTPLTSDRNNLRRAVERAQIGEEYGTTLREAVDETVNRSFAGLKGRKAIVLLTDGVDFGSSVSTEDLMYSLEESDTLIYPIFYQQNGDLGVRNRGGIMLPRGGRGGIFGGRLPGGGNFPGRRRVEKLNQKAEEFLQQLADATAGRFYRSDVADLNATFKNVVDELRFQYRLGFYPPDGAGEDVVHQLKVKVARSDVAVRARSSYRTQSKTEQSAAQPTK